MREEFEKLPDIKSHLDHGNVFWSDDNKRYLSDFSSLSTIASYVNGAWYAYQEQEERFNKRRPELDSDTCSDIRNHISPLTKVIDR